MSFRCNFLLSTLVVFGLNADCFRRGEVLETGRLIKSIRSLFVHFFYLFDNLVSLLLEKSDVSGLLLNCLLKLLYLLAKTFIFREKYNVLLSN